MARWLYKVFYETTPIVYIVLSLFEGEPLPIEV